MAPAAAPQTTWRGRRRGGGADARPHGPGITARRLHRLNAVLSPVSVRASPEGCCSRHAPGRYGAGVIEVMGGAEGRRAGLRGCTPAASRAWRPFVVEPWSRPVDQGVRDEGVIAAVYVAR